MTSTTSTITRRQLLARGALGAAGLAVAGAGGELITAALASGPAPPKAPRWHSRPDLRIPALTVTTSGAAASQDAIFIAPYNAPDPAQAGAVLVSASGEPLWENPIAGKVTTDFRVQTYRGETVLTWWQGNIVNGHGVGEYVIADTSYRPIRTVQAGNNLRGDLHEFVITPQDTALYSTYLTRQADLSRVGGSRNGSVEDAIFQEQDLASGQILLEWHSLDHVPVTESYYPLKDDWDFFHLNSIDIDHDGNVLISSRSMHAVYKIDRATGAIIWRLGGKASNFTLGPGVRFAWQHDARRRPDGTLSLFDNGSTPPVEGRSRALILALDERAMHASLVRQYTHPKVLSGSQGNMQVLPNGNVFVGWGEVPRVSEFDHSGQIIFDALLGKDYQCYRGFRLPWQATPADPPALAVSREAGGARAWASWNGATDVAAWRLLAGASAAALSRAASARTQGFETSLHSSSSGPFFAAEAVGADGATLGRSPTMQA